jgi:hypothetical protein
VGTLLDAVRKVGAGHVERVFDLKQRDWGLEIESLSMKAKLFLYPAIKLAGLGHLAAGKAKDYQSRDIRCAGRVHYPKSNPVASIGLTIASRNQIAARITKLAGRECLIF